MLEMVTSSVPLFVTVEVCEAVAPSSMSFDPNDSEVGDGGRCLCSPLPPYATLSRSAFEWTVTEPDLSPVVDGSNAIRSSHVLPACSTIAAAQSVDWNGAGEERAGTSMLEMVTSSEPVFVTVEVCEAVAPSSMSFDPNDSEVGDGDSCVCVPVPSTATDTSAAFEWTVTGPDFPPTVDGSNAIRSSHVLPACSTIAAAQS